MDLTCPPALVEFLITFPINVCIFSASSTNVMALASKSSSLAAWACAEVHFGETAEPKEDIELAAAWDTAQYKTAMLKLHNLSNLLGVRGSKTGRLIAEDAKLISATVDGRLKRNKFKKCPS